MNGPTVSVVICAYTTDRWVRLQAAVGSVLDQEQPADHVYVVVDHNAELEQRARAAFAGLGVTVLASTGEPGLSGARNTGTERSADDVVVFLDDDAVADPGWLAAHAAHYRDPDVLGVGGLVAPDWEEGPPRWFPEEFGWVVGCAYVGQPTSTAVVRNAIGANMSFRREVIASVGGFSESLGRVGTTPDGCEETELSIRAAIAHPRGRILHEPTAAVRHHVPASRGRWSYFRRRCWAEGRSKARVAHLADPRDALSSERTYVSRTLPDGVRRGLVEAARRRDPAALARAGAICAGLAITVAGFTAAHIRTSQTKTRQGKETAMSDRTRTDEWLNFDVQGRLGIRVEADAPAAAQLRAMLACFATADSVPADITVSRGHEEMPDASQVEDDLRYTADGIEFVHEDVQVVRDGDRFRIHGNGELLTTLVPVLDRAMVERGAAMFHAATVAYRGHAVALPAAGGTGKTSTVAKLMRKEGFSFMGDDWAFLSDDKTLIGYEKPMFIKPHHRPIYPHLFEGARKPMIPSALSRPVGRLTTVVHPYVIRYPRLADVARRWSPEHRMVDAATALPGVPVTRDAPLLVAMYLERHEGAAAELVETTEQWMVDRMLGNFQIEMASFSQEVVTAMAATSMVSWRQLADAKGDILAKALAGVPCYLLKVPAAFSADRASDEVVRILDEVLPAVPAVTEKA